MKTKDEMNEELLANKAASLKKNRKEMRK